MLEHLLHHFNFSWTLPEKEQLLPISYNYWLVAVSYCIALLAGYMGFRISQLAKEKMANKHSSIDLILVGSMVMGIGIWSMHFIAMLAYSIGEPINYNLPVTLFSVLPALIASYATLKAISHIQFNNMQKVHYGLVIGLGIGAMHFIGMAAMYHDANAVYHTGTFIISIALAWVLGVMTLNIRLSKYLTTKLSVNGVMWISASLWALAVCAMHYTGMYAISFTSGEGKPLTDGISSQGLIWPVSIISFLLILVTLGFISSQKRLFIASAEASRNKEHLLEAIEEMSDGFLLCDPQGIPLMRNQKLYDILPQAEDINMDTVHQLFDWLMGSKLHETVKQENRDFLLEQLITNITLAEPIEFQLEDERWLQVKQSQTSSGSTMRIISDISARKKAENALFEEEKMQSLSRMVSGVAHEVNTPLGICLTLSSQFEGETKSITKTYENAEVSQEQFEGYLSNMGRISDLLMSNIRRAANLISSFKQVAVDQTILETETIHLRPYIDKIFLALKSEYKRYSPEIIISCDNGFKLETVPGTFSQIIMNFVKNSSLHAFEGIENPVMSLDVIPKGDEVEIVYRDNGVGMTEETLEKIFEPFYTTKRQNGGTGLGMHIVFNLITQKLKGKIKVESKEGEGCAFYMVFPVKLTV